jgi:hypothetical protein
VSNRPFVMRWVRAAHGGGRECGSCQFRRLLHDGRCAKKAALLYRLLRLRLSSRRLLVPSSPARRGESPKVALCDDFLWHL